ncbi:MAG: hypothetical protein ACR2IK_25145 [Chloroflexota bacterium]
MKTLISNGTVATARDTFKADVLIDGEVVGAIGAELSRDSVDRTIDARDRYVLPGGVDVHTHMEMPSSGTVTADNFESGTLAAAFWRHNDDRRLRHAAAGWIAASNARAT